MPSPQLIDLLQKGYFPKELPPTFSTATFGLVAMARSTELEDAYNKCKWASLCRFFFARPGTLRRILSIPNPLFYSKLAKTVCDGWAYIDAHVSQSRLTRSKPTASAIGRAIEPEVPRKSIFDVRAEYRATNRFMLQADVSQFYPTVYTHSIPWAMHTRPVAKSRRRDSTLLGNLLDGQIQSGQDSQTKGMPIGPDTSLVIGELLLSQCDAILLDRIPDLHGFRYYDDYELYFDTKDAAEKTLPELERVLAEYDLSLNPAKSRVESVLQPIDFPWARIRRIEVREEPQRQHNDLIYLFEEAFELARIRPTDHVLKYAIGRLDDVVIHEDNWRTYICLLCQSAMIEPAVLPLILNQLLRRKHSVEEKALADKDLLMRVLNKHIVSHAYAGNSSEVAWAVWGAIALKLRLDSFATSAVCRMEDSVVALLGLAARNENLLDSVSVNERWWVSQMQPAALLEEHWLLAYEADAQGWLTRAASPAGLDSRVQAALVSFDLLKAEGVRFFAPHFGYDPTRSHTDSYGDASAGPRMQESVSRTIGQAGNVETFTVSTFTSPQVAATPPVPGDHAIQTQSMSQEETTESTLGDELDDNSERENGVSDVSDEDDGIPF